MTNLAPDTPHRRLARECFHGRRELHAYVGRCDMALGDSEFNRQDLEALGFPGTAVLPVIPDLTHLDDPADWFVARQFDDDWTNILFVGRIIPNKKFEDLIRFYAAYQSDFNRRSRLLPVGSAIDFEWYLDTLHHLVRRLKLEHVHFAGQVSNATLAAYYDVADVFLCAAEHEGFCVPLIEAYHAGIPVAAFAATAPRHAQIEALLGRSTRRRLGASRSLAAESCAPEYPRRMPLVGASTLRSPKARGACSRSTGSCSTACR